MRWGYLGIALVYFAVAGAEVTLHWYMRQDSVAARHLLDKYLYLDPHNGKPYVEGLVDLIVPAILMGIAAGSIGNRWTSDELACCVLLLSLGLMGLFPLYYAMLSEHAVLLKWPVTALGWLYVLIRGYVAIGIVCGVFAYVARVLVAELLRPGTCTGLSQP